MSNDPTPTTDPMTKGSLNITVSMTKGLWRYLVTDSSSFLGGSFGFVSPERAFAAALETIEAAIEDVNGYDEGNGNWVKADINGN